MIPFCLKILKNYLVNVITYSPASETLLRMNKVGVEIFATIFGGYTKLHVMEFVFVALLKMPIKKIKSTEDFTCVTCAAILHMNSAVA